MRGNPLDNAYRSAEAAGFPALLIVSMISLALVVVPVALLGLTRADWALAVALLGMVAALALLAAGIGAAFNDSDGPSERSRESAVADRPRDSVAALPRRERETEHDRQRTAA